MSTPVLQVQGVSKRFGGLQALSEVGLTIMPGQIYGLIGPNGAGKTTFFNVITGMYTPDAGQFLLQGQPYEPTAVHDVARAGIARTFQNIRLFGEMTALENVMVGRHVRTDSGVWGAVFRSRGFVAQERAMAEHAQALLEEVGLGESAGLKARTLSYGDQRRLEIARALACEPRFMLLDEPFAGVDPISIIDIQKIILHLRERGIGILDPAVAHRADGRENCGLVAPGVRHAREWHGARPQVLLDAVDDREVGFRTLGIERNEPRYERDGVFPEFATHTRIRRERCRNRFS